MARVKLWKEGCECIEVSGTAQTYTQKEIAEQLGVAKSTYANYELSYREPGIATIQSISSVLETSVDYLLGLSDNPDIAATETNAKLLLQSNRLHWDGIKLEEEDLKLIREFLEFVVKERMESKEPHQKRSMG
jgi:transcriptional regulator with XRE-family HTH domain